MSNELTHAELFAGYGGLSLAVEEAFGARLAWYAEFDDAPSKIMEHHWPDVTNYGDVTAIDWTTVPKVNVLSGGSPCQDVSNAGRRGGMSEGTRSNLWTAMREAIATIQPDFVVWENVRGAHSAKAASASDMEPEDGSVGEVRRNLRALGRVLGDLAGLGYDAEWRVARASAVGAPHRRERVFVLAWRADTLPPTNSNGRRAGRRNGGPGGAETEGSVDQALLSDREPRRPGAVEELKLLPTPLAAPSGNTPENHLRKKPGRTQVTDLGIIAENNLFETGGKLLPTPNTMDTLDPRSDEALARAKLKGGCSNLKDTELIRNPKVKLLPTVTTSEATGAGHAGNGGKNLRTTVSEDLSPGLSPEDLEILGEDPRLLLPTPRATRGGSATETAYLLGGERTDEGRPQGEVVLKTVDFGPYAPAIHRWERVTGNPVPAPTELSPRGRHRLSEYFTEWMMGLPAGWICDVPGISRNDKVKAAGNGVVPLQAYAALEEMRLRYEETVLDDILG